MTIIVNTTSFIQILIIYIESPLTSFFIVHQSQLNNLKVVKSVVCLNLLAINHIPSFLHPQRLGLGVSFRIQRLCRHDVSTTFF